VKARSVLLLAAVIIPPLACGKRVPPPVADPVVLTPQQDHLSTGTAPTEWHKVDAGPFSLFAPLGWEFHQLTGIDSYVGEFVGDGVALRFDFGGYSSGYIKKFKKPAYVIAREFIHGFPAKVVSPRTPATESRAYISAMSVTRMSSFFGAKTSHPHNRNWR
jgi:hypothetical protein